MLYFLSILEKKFSFRFCWRIFYPFILISKKIFGGHVEKKFRTPTLLFATYMYLNFPCFKLKCVPRHLDYFQFFAQPSKYLFSIAGCHHSPSFFPRIQSSKSAQGQSEERWKRQRKRKGERKKEMIFLLQLFCFLLCFFLYFYFLSILLLINCSLFYALFIELE